MVISFGLPDNGGRIVHSVRDHHSASQKWRPETPLLTKRLTPRVLATHGAPAVVFRVSCFPSPSHFPVESPRKTSNSPIVHIVETTAIAGAVKQEAGVLGDFLEMRVDGI